MTAFAPVQVQSQRVLVKLDLLIEVSHFEMDITGFGVGVNTVGRAGFVEFLF